MLGQLPTEILEPILRACNQSDAYATHLQWRLLALVCRRFRDILMPIRYEVISCQELVSTDDTDHDASPFSQELKRNPWKAILVKSLTAYLIHHPISFLQMFPNLTIVDLDHQNPAMALRNLPMQENLFPQLREFRLADYEYSVGCDVLLSDIARIWIQPKLEMLSISSIEIDLRGGILLEASLPPIKVMKLYDCHVKDSRVSSLIQVRSVQHLMILNCATTPLLMIDSTKHWLKNLTLVEEKGADENIARCLNAVPLKQLNVDVRTLLVCEYGKIGLEAIGRRPGPDWDRIQNGLELPDLEKLTVIFDGAVEEDPDLACYMIELVWTPATFRHIMTSVRYLAPGLKMVVYKFKGSMYEILYKDFHHNIDDLKRSGQTDGLEVEFEFYEDEETLDPKEKHGQYTTFHSDEYLRFLLEKSSVKKENEEDKMDSDMGEV